MVSKLKAVRMRLRSFLLETPVGIAELSCATRIAVSSALTQRLRGHGRTRYTYDCEHVFHVRCIREHFASMYSPDVLQSNSSSSNSITDRKWVAPDGWKCPSCIGCVWTKTLYCTNARVFYCQHCLSSFKQEPAQRAGMVCFFCKLIM